MSSESLPINVKLLSVESPDYVPRPGEGVPRRHPLIQDGQFIVTYNEEVRTLYESFNHAVSKYGMNALLYF